MSDEQSGGVKETPVKAVKVVFEADVIVGDFQHPDGMAAMLAKVRNNITRAGSLAAFKDWITRDRDKAESQLMTALARWQNLKEQENFMTKMMSGEVPFVEEHPAVDAPKAGAQ